MHLNSTRERFLFGLHRMLVNCQRNVRRLAYTGGESELQQLRGYLPMNR